MKANGAWEQKEADEIHDLASSPNLAAWLNIFFFPDKDDVTVFDFGCGKGYYLAQLEQAGFSVQGIEGTELNNFLTKKPVYIHDLSQPVKLSLSSGQFRQGNVISLEVGEHIPKEGEHNFLDTITNHCSRKLVMSWALPGQPGLGHVNCQPQDYIIKQIMDRGFKYLMKETIEARLVIEQHCDWFQRTLLVFERA